jgi:hypothetical protein
VQRHSAQREEDTVQMIGVSCHPAQNVSTNISTWRLKFFYGGSVCRRSLEERHGSRRRA